MRTLSYIEIPIYSTICYSNHTLLGKAQKKFTGATITHLSIKMDNEYVLENGLSNTTLGVQYTKFKDTLKQTSLNKLHALSPKFEIDDIKAKEITELAFKIKIRYSFKELIFLLIYKFTKVWLGDKDEKTTVCSTFRSWWYNRVCGLYSDWYTYSPQRVFDEAELNGFEIVKIEI
jgi:hypothetical protein